jgi:carbon-monoxide dehydrogenase large subunit
MRPEGALRAVFVRSIIAHGRLSGIDVGVARTMPGVAAVLVASDLELDAQPPAGNVTDGFARAIPASDVVRYVGEPVAVVLADTLERAEDAVEAVVVEVEPIDPVLGAEAALAGGAPILFPDAGTNWPTSLPRAPRSSRARSCTSASRRCLWRRTRSWSSDG